MNVENIYATFPELFLASCALMLLLFGVKRGNDATLFTGLIAVVVCLAAGVLLIKLPSFVEPGQAQLGVSALCHGCKAFGGMFINDAFAQFVKVLLLLASAIAIMLSWGYMERHGLERPEYPALILFATLGMMLMVSANDLLALYMGLELQSLALYVLASFRRDHVRSSEAGLKYFVLGSLSSGMLLYGISLLYGYTGSTGFEALAHVLAGEPPIGVVLGLVFVCAAMAFKVSAVPFHMWTPDVYEGAPTPVTAFFAAGPKLAALALFVRVLLQPLAGLEHQWVQVVVFMAVASMLLGSFAGLAQSNIKRLMAYSSIANVGYALVGMAVANEAGVQALLVYLSIYLVNTLGVFGVILCLRREGVMAEKIADLAGLSKSHPLLAVAMGIFMFSLAGVPPLAGFFGKYFVFLAAVQAGMLPLAIIGVLTSCVAAYYYLRIIKVMYFDDATEAAVDPVPEFSLRIVTGGAALLMLLFVFMPTPVIDSALAAAHSLMPQG